MDQKDIIYLAGPILSCTDKEMNGWRKQVMNELCFTYEFLNPTRRIYLNNDENSIVHGDKEDIDKSQIILVDHQFPSDGTAMEIIYAWERGKTIITIVQGEYSPWISYHSNILFETVNHAISYLKDIK